LLVHNTNPWAIWFSYDPTLINGEWTFEAGPWAGRTLNEAVNEAIELGELPEGLELNATWWNDLTMVALNNRTLWVAQQAGLENVPVYGLESNKVWERVRWHLNKNGGSPFEPCY
jgi:hypothetical protein